MVSSLEIFGLSLGLVYALATPVAAYFLFRRPLALKARDIFVGFVGASIAAGLRRAIVTPAIQALFAFLMREHFSLGFNYFFYDFLLRSATQAATALTCLLLLFVFASTTSGRSPGFAYGLGAGGAYCLQRAAGLYLYLRWASSANGDGQLEWWDESPEILTKFFSQGIPNGAGAVAHFLVAVGLSLLIWKGLREKRWALVGAAILVAIAWDIVQMLAERLPALGAPHSFESPVSPEILESGLGLVAVALLYWRAPMLEAFGAFARRRAGREPGLLSVWRDQAGRESGD